MEKLLKEKLKAAQKLKIFTEEIMVLSLKTDYIKVNSMIDQRQQRIEKINNINEEIYKKNNSIEKDIEQIDSLKKEIREVFKDIVEIDKLMHNNITNELKIVKKKLNQPEELINSLNIKV